MTLRDFMNYLLYVEYAAENLQFYLWHQDYVERFNAAPTSDIALSPEWTPAMEAEVYAKLQREATEAAAARVAGPTSPIEAEIFKGTDFDKETAVDGGDFAISRSNPFATPPRTRGSENADRESTTFAPSVLSDATTTRTQANNAIAAAGASTPCKYPPNRP